MKHVSVLIAAFHAQEFIARSVLSVLRQSYPQWEVVIASDDLVDYQQILHDQGIQDARISFVSTSRVGAGPAVARNTALANAKGDIIAVLDADDAFAPQKLERLVPAVIEHGAATSDVRIIEAANGRIYPSLAKSYPEGLLLAQDYIRANIHTFSILMWDRKRLYGRWDEAVPCLEDLVHGLSMYNAMNGIYYIPAALHDYYKHNNSITNQTNAQTHESETAKHMIASCRDLLTRAERHDLPLTNSTALLAFTRYVSALMALEEQFLDEHIEDAVMGYYHFMERNHAAFDAW